MGHSLSLHVDGILVPSPWTTLEPTTLTRVHQPKPVLLEQSLKENCFLNTEVNNLFLVFIFLDASVLFILLSLQYSQVSSSHVF